MAIGAVALEAVRTAPRPAEPPVPMPPAYRDLLGFYADPDDGLLWRVEWRDGVLAVIDPDDPDWRPVLEPAEPDAFVVSAGWRESGEPAVFLRRSDGRVRGLVLGPQSLARLDPVDQ